MDEVKGNRPSALESGKLIAKVAAIVFGSEIVARSLGVLPMFFILFPVLRSPRPKIAAMLAAAAFVFLFTQCLNAALAWWLLNRFVLRLSFLVTIGLYLFVWAIAVFVVGRFLWQGSTGAPGALALWLVANALICAVIIQIAGRDPLMPERPLSEGFS